MALMTLLAFNWSAAWTVLGVILSVPGWAVAVVSLFMLALYFLIEVCGLDGAVSAGITATVAIVVAIFILVGVSVPEGVEPFKPIPTQVEQSCP